MYFHGFRVKVNKGDQANFTPDEAYRVLAMKSDKPTKAFFMPASLRS